MITVCSLSLFVICSFFFNFVCVLPLVQNGKEKAINVSKIEEAASLETSATGKEEESDGDDSADGQENPFLAESAKSDSPMTVLPQTETPNWTWNGDDDDSAGLKRDKKRKIEGKSPASEPAKKKRKSNEGVSIPSKETVRPKIEVPVIKLEGKEQAQRIMTKFKELTGRHEVHCHFDFQE